MKSDSRSPPRRALLVALHFPPYTAASGYRRTLKFVEGLPEHGWHPLVLTATRSAFRDEQMGGDEAPPQGVDVIRALSLDAQRHFAVRGRYPRLLALPDRWSTWWFDAVRKGLTAVRRHRPSVLYSTYPIATAHLVGWTLSRMTGLPWVADFRDPMIDGGYPHVRSERAVRARLERATLGRCSRAVFTTVGAHDMYRSRYAELPASQFTVIPNGYDEQSFARAGSVGRPEPREGAPVTLLHSGVLYRDVRNPRHLFEAIARLVACRAVERTGLRVVLRAAATDDFVRDLARAVGVEDMIELAPGLPYVEALREMIGVDGLLLLQGSGSNQQVPAKLYEYLRAGRPVLALTDPAGDTARVLRDAGTGIITRMDDAAEIEVALREFLDGLRAGTLTGCDRAVVERFSRAAGTRAIAQVFDELSADTAS